jgi:hypothetical protein
MMLHSTCYAQTELKSPLNTIKTQHNRQTVSAHYIQAQFIDQDHTYATKGAVLHTLSVSARTEHHATLYYTCLLTAAAAWLSTPGMATFLTSVM